MFLGFCLGGDGVRTDERISELISKLKSPPNERSLKSFLSLMGYFRRFIHHFADHVAMFLPFLKKNSEWKWTKEHENKYIIFELIKEPIMLHHLQCVYTFKITSDASQVGCGYCLLSIKQGTSRGQSHYLYTAADFGQMRKKTISLQSTRVVRHLSRCHTLSQICHVQKVQNSN